MAAYISTLYRQRIVHRKSVDAIRSMKRGVHMSKSRRWIHWVRYENPSPTPYTSTHQTSRITAFHRLKYAILFQRELFQTTPENTAVPSGYILIKALI